MNHDGKRATEIHTEEAVASLKTSRLRCSGTHRRLPSSLEWPKTALLITVNVSAGLNHTHRHTRRRSP